MNLYQMRKNGIEIVLGVWKWLESATFSKSVTVTKNLTVGETLTLAGASQTHQIAGKILIDGDLELTTGQYQKGTRQSILFIATFPWVAPAPGKLIEAREVHDVISTGAATRTLEKLNTGEAPGAGDVMLASAFNLQSTVNVPVTKAAVATAAASFIAGDSIVVKGTGDASDYAGAISFVVEWL